MKPQHWPLYGLRLRTPRLELRLPDLELLDELASVAADGVHAPDEMPFTVPWTAVPPEERGKVVFQHVLSTVADWSVRDWALSLAVLCEGRVVGRQDLMARDFAVTGQVSTGSWLGLAHQGRGIGTEMRAAVLHLAFAGLGARTAVSAAMTDNPRSLGSRTGSAICRTAPPSPLYGERRSPCNGCGWTGRAGRSTGASRSPSRVSTAAGRSSAHDAAGPHLRPRPAGEAAASRRPEDGGDMAGLESSRTRPWGSEPARALGARLLPRPADDDLW